MRSLRFVACAFSAFVLAACADRTSLLVEVTSPLAIPDRVNGLELRVVGDAAGSMIDRTYDLTTGWPHTVSLRPGQIESQGITITVTALHDGAFVARRVVHETFVRGEERVVHVVIDAECADVRCDDGVDCVGGRCVGATNDAGVPDGGRMDGGAADGGTADGGGGKGDAGTDAGSCQMAADCDDGVNCTVDTCVDGSCDHQPDDTICQDGLSCDLTAGCPPRACTMDAECNDGVACNGSEVCVDTVCTHSDPVDCNDGDACTDDACSEPMGGVCVHTTKDSDADGYGDLSCPELGAVPATDCNDRNPEAFPGAPEVCNGLDDDCDSVCDQTFTCCRGEIAECETSCHTIGTHVCGLACSWDICSPPAEVCNGIDDNCNDAVDEGCGSCASCSGAIGVTPPGGRYDVTLGPDAQSGSCGGAGGAEGYLTFRLTSASDVFITTHQAGSTDTVLYVRQCTCTGTEVAGACNDDADGRATSSLRLTNLPSGTYNVVVDTKTGTPGTVVPVDVYITEPGTESDRCGNPTFITAGTTNLTGDTCAFSTDYQPALGGACAYSGTGAARDRVFYFYVPTTRTVSISGCTSGSIYDQTMYLRSVCTDGSAAAQPICNDDGCSGGPSCDARLRSSFSTTLGPGLYYLVVDGYLGGSCDCGAYQLSMSGI